MFLLVLGFPEVSRCESIQGLIRAFTKQTAGTTEPSVIPLLSNAIITPCTSAVDHCRLAQINEQSELLSLGDDGLPVTRTDPPPKIIHVYDGQKASGYIFVTGTILKIEV